MSNGVNYAVTVDFSQTGDLSRPNAQLGAMAGNAYRMGQSLERVGSGVSKLGDTLLSAVGSAASLVGHMGALAGAAGIAAVVYGLTQVNAELEDTKIGLAALFVGNDVTSTFKDGLLLAGKTMQTMRKDAAALPGELKDLTNIFQTMSTAGLQAGMSTEALEKFSAKTMVLAAVTKVGFATAGREMAAMLEGRATNRMPMFAKLGTGMSATDFNKLDIEKRRKILEERSSAIGSPEAIAAYQHSWVGLTTTVKDYFKQFVGNSTSDVFERAKDSLDKVTNWYTSNQATVQKWTEKISAYLVSAFDTGEKFILRWWPATQTFLGNLQSEMTRIWDKVDGLVSTIGANIRDFMGDDAGPSKLIKGLEHALELGLALKVAGAALQIGGTVTTGIGSMMGPGAGALGALGGIVAVSVLAFGAVSVAGFMDALAARPVGDKIHDDAVLAKQQLDSNTARLRGDLGVDRDGIDKLGVQAADTAGALAGLMASFLFWDKRLGGEGTLFEKLTPDAIHKDAYEEIQRPIMDIMGLKKMEGYADQGIEKDPKKNVPPNHHTTIHKVEIVVNSNQDPSRIARLTVDKLAQFARHPTASPGVTNFAPR